MQFETLNKVATKKVEYHPQLVWVSVILASLSISLFALEFLAPAGVLGVVAVILQGVDAA
jgi:hypothetical protein